MDAINDEDRKNRLRMLEEKILHERSITSVDCLLVCELILLPLKSSLKYYRYFLHFLGHGSSARGRL